MVTVHGAARCLAVANVTDQTDYGIEVNFKRAVSLLRTFSLQMETLKRHRSNGEQHCTVEHVHVHPGGKAVVSNVSQDNSQTNNLVKVSAKEVEKDEKK